MRRSGAALTLSFLFCQVGSAPWAMASATVVTSSSAHASTSRCISSLCDGVGAIAETVRLAAAARFCGKARPVASPPCRSESGGTPLGARVLRQAPWWRAVRKAGKCTISETLPTGEKHKMLCRRSLVVLRGPSVGERSKGSSLTLQTFPSLCTDEPARLFLLLQAWPSTL